MCRLGRRAARLAGLRFFRFLSREIDPQPVPRPAQIELGFPTEPQMLDLCGHPELDLRASSVAAAFERGDLCALARDGGRVAGYCWFAFRPLPHLDDVWVRFGPDVAWTYKSLVLPHYRGRGIAGLLYRFADAACRERQRARAVICVESHNASSIRAAQRASFADAGSGGYLRRGPLFFDWYRSTLRPDGVSFFTT